MNETGDRRLLVIGLDGATFDVIRPLVARGELPCLGELLSRGGSAPLLSTVPPLTPPAWSSFATGVPPHEHGVFGFNYPDRDHALRLTTASDLRRPTFWRRLGDAGARVLLLDVPFTFPPEPVNGCLVSGFPLPAGAPFTHPPDLAAHMQSAGISCVPHPVESPDPGSPGFLKRLGQFMDERVRIFRHLSSAQPWQFAMVGTMALDWAQHALWRYFDPRFIFAHEPEAAERRETLHAAYRRADRFVADLLEVAGVETRVLLVSDHGFGTAFHYDWINEALSQAGLLFWRGKHRGPLAALGSAALNAARSSPRLQRLAKRALGDTAAARAWARRARAHSRIDWSRTRVFPAGDYQLNLYVNRRSRFAGGIVDDGADCEKVIADAVAALERFRPPGHDLPLVRRIARHDRAARDSAIPCPDLSLELTVLPNPAGARVQPLAGICGFHSPEGILIAGSTELLNPDPSLPIPITDVAPAILKYFDVQLDVADQTGAAPASPALSNGQTAGLLDSLRHLGYLD